MDKNKRKGASAEATARIGAILGGGTKSEIAVLGHYGRTYGVLLTLRDEFIDIFEAEELKNRVENEVLPLPILLAFHDAAKKTAILQLLKGQVTEDNIEQILDLSLDDPETIDLTKKMRRMVQEESLKLSFVKNCSSGLKLLL